MQLLTKSFLNMQRKCKFLSLFDMANGWILIRIKRDSSILEQKFISNEIIRINGCNRFSFNDPWTDYMFKNHSKIKNVKFTLTCNFDVNSMLIMEINRNASKFMTKQLLFIIYLSLFFLLHSLEQQFWAKKK